MHSSVLNNAIGQLTSYVIVAEVRVISRAIAHRVERELSTVLLLELQALAIGNSTQSMQT